MIKFICFVALIGVCHAASIRCGDSSTAQKEIIPVLSFESDKKPDGSFSFTYEGGDKSFREETGVVENAGTDDEALEVSGSYRYIDADGREVEVHYTAGRNGFVPVGTYILPEITALARAAADLPNQDEDDEQHSPRKSRARVVEKERRIKVEVVEDKPVRRIEARNFEVKKPVQIKVLDQTPVEKKPIERKPVEKKPVEKKPVERKPVEKKPVEKKPVEKQSVENKKAEVKKVEEAQSQEKKEEESKPEEKEEEVSKPEEKKSEDKKLEEVKPAEKKSVEKKPTEKKRDSKNP